VYVYVDGASKEALGGRRGPLLRSRSLARESDQDDTARKRGGNGSGPTHAQFVSLKISSTFARTRTGIGVAS
jgi:hypothetical protein